MKQIVLLVLLAATACSQPQPQPLAQLGPETRKALASAQLFARKVGMAGDCLSPGPREHYSIKDAADTWVVEVEPPPRPGPVLRLTVSKDNLRVIRAQKIA
jgi:hypothetical protein